MSKAVLRPASGFLTAPDEESAGSWSEWLQGRIIRDWRPGQFDFDRLLYVPDPNDKHTAISVCVRPGCGILLPAALLCPSCRSEYRDVRDEMSLEDFGKTPRVRVVEMRYGCLIEGCERGHQHQGLCRNHLTTYRRAKAQADAPLTVEEWVSTSAARALPPTDKCLAEVCGRDQAGPDGLCTSHRTRYFQWLKETSDGQAGTSVDVWLQRDVEPPMDPDTLATYAAAAATPFALLPDPLRWELLYAVQQRDLEGRANIRPFGIRSIYLHLRRNGWTTAVGMKDLNRKPDKNRYMNGMLSDMQRIIDAAHREWSGSDDRDPRILYWSELEVRQTSLKYGPGAKTDLTEIQQPWIYESIIDWAKRVPRGVFNIDHVGRVWTMADSVLRTRGTPTKALGVADMDAIVKALKERYRTKAAQKKAFHAITILIEYGHRSEELQHYWGQIPARFSIDPARHITDTDKGSRNEDEPFRFVPQPIIDWLMDHLHLIDRGDPYLTAEARAMIFLQERCGRRTGETLALADDCISYDNQGSPYLEWTRGKPPYGPGKRLPIHQETHDVIREWQRIKAEAGVKSKWLFPSSAYATKDDHFRLKVLSSRISELIALVKQHAPFVGPVEGAEGNLVYFDMDSIDPYSFRHAFAQRLADATDADGRPTTPPDVLQDYMGHKNFNTTMAYYEVTAKRRKKALQGIAPRRLALHGKVVEVDRERDGFTKIAVTHGNCTEPQNVAAGGHFCMLEHSCESCPFFLVDPLERDGMVAKRHHIKVKLERAKAIKAQQHVLDHYEARIKDCTNIIDGIDAYIDGLPGEERDQIHEALDRMAEIRRRATAPRTIDLRGLLSGGTPDAV